MAELRQRQVSKKKSPATFPNSKSEKSALLEAEVPEVYVKKSKSDDKYKLALIAVTALAFVTRFYLLNFPTEVVYVTSIRCFVL